jgi:hypothetical protein
VAAEEAVADALRAMGEDAPFVGPRMLAAGAEVLCGALSPDVVRHGRALDLAGQMFLAMAASEREAGEVGDAVASAVRVAVAAETDACARVVNDLLCLKEPKDPDAALRVRNAWDGAGPGDHISERTRRLGWAIVLELLENRTRDAFAAVDRTPHSERLPFGYGVSDSALNGWTWTAPDGYRGFAAAKVAAIDAAWVHSEDPRRPKAEGAAR